MVSFKPLIRHGLPVWCLLLFTSALWAQSGQVTLDFELKNPTSCNVEDGQIILKPTNGTPPYQYSINGGGSFQSDSIFNNLSIGTYILHVRDAQQLFSSYILVRLVADAAPVIRSIVMVNPEKCGKGGTLKILIEGSSNGLEYSIDGGQSFHPNSVFSDVKAGMYDVRVRNADASCVASYPTITFDPIEPSEGINIQLNPQHPDCDSLNGAIQVEVTGGSGNYLYSINNGNSFQSEANFTNLGAGSYSFLIVDTVLQCGVQANQTVVLEGSNCHQCDSIKIAPKIAHPNCGFPNGTLDFIVTGGSGNYMYSINNGTDFSASSRFENLGAGSYAVLIRDLTNQCETQTAQTVILNDQDCPKCDSIDIQVQPTIKHPSCDFQNGTLELAVTGGSGDYTYSINNGTDFFASSTFENLGAGSYEILIRDRVNQCEMQMAQTVILDNQDCPKCDSIDIQIQPTIKHPDCDSLNGTLDIVVAGGSGNYTYSINNGADFFASSKFENLGADSYEILIRDRDNECESKTAITAVLEGQDCSKCDSIDIQPLIKYPNCDSLNGQIELIVKGGSGNYLISVNGGAFQKEPIFNNLGAMSYTFLVQDSLNNCEKTFAAIDLSDNCVCTDVIAATSMQMTVDNCEEQKAICLDLPLSVYLNFDLYANGTLYAGEAVGCQYDSLLSYLYFTFPGDGLEGPYRLDRWEVNGTSFTGEFQTINDLVQLMNGLDPQANWEKDATSRMLTGGFPSNNYGALEITQINTNLSESLQFSKTIKPLGTQIVLDTGRHSLVFIEKTNNCRDSLLIDISCPSDCGTFTLSGASVIDVTDCNDRNLFCFEGLDAAQIAAYEITDNGSSYTGAIENCADMMNGFSLELDTGMHQIIFSQTALGCEDTFNLAVTCPTTIDDTLRIDTSIIVGEIDTICFAQYLMDNTVTDISPTCEGHSPDVGFEINNITNCLVYEGLQIGQDTICLKVCKENGDCIDIIITVQVVEKEDCSSIFSELTQTLKLSHCDSTINYCLNIPKQDLSGYQLTINDTIYAGTFEDCNQGDQAALALSEGRYELIINSLTDANCADTVLLNVECETKELVFMDTVLVNEMDTFCIDSLYFDGEIASIKNVCEDKAGEYVLFDLDTMNFCIRYTGIEAGIDTACIETCDAMGNCDTISVIITVEPEPDTIPLPIAVDDLDSLVKGETKTINILGNDTTNSTMITVIIIENPTHGTATINPDLTLTYVPDDTVCNVTDSLVYELCNPSGCDTATVHIMINCKTLKIYTGFSPNGDGINDTFTIEGIEAFPNNHLYILNRWGEEVYEQAGYKGQWDGTWENKKLPDGVYFYMLDDGVGKKYSGYLMIRR